MSAQALSTPREATGPLWVPDYPGHPAYPNRPPLHLSPNLEGPHCCPKGLWEKALAMGVPEGAERALPFPRGLCRTLPHPSWGSSAPGQRITLGMCVSLLRVRPAENQKLAGPTASLPTRAVLGGLGDRQTLQGTEGPPSPGTGVLAHPAEAEDGEERAGLAGPVGCAAGTAGNRRTQRKLPVGPRALGPATC